MVWNSLTRGKTVKTERIFVRDARNVFDFSRWEHVEADIEPPSSDLLSEEWIRKEFFNAILGTPEGRRDLVLNNPRETIYESVTRSLPDIEAIARDMENQVLHLDLIHGHRIERENPATNIHEILCHKDLGERNRTHMNVVDIDGAIKNAVTNNQPLRVILPAFPFKDQNPFRTEARPSHTDLSEIIMLVQIFTFVSCLRAVLPSIGVEFIITCDGVIYSDIFNVDKTEVIKYRERVRSYRNLLNLQQLVHIIDIADMIKCFDNFEEVLRTVGDYLNKEVDRSPTMKNQFDVLTRGIKFNLNLRHYGDKYGLQVLARCLDDAVKESDLSHKEITIREDIDSSGREAARKYISLHMAMKYCNIINRMFPGALRATVHPKPGQIGIAKRGSVFPWNGVAFVNLSQEESLWRNTETVELSRVHNKAQGRILRRVFLEGDSDPFYYEITGDN